MPMSRYGSLASLLSLEEQEPPKRQRTLAPQQQCTRLNIGSGLGPTSGLALTPAPQLHAPQQDSLSLSGLSTPSPSRALLAEPPPLQPPSDRPAKSAGAGSGPAADVHALVDPSLVALRAELAGDGAVPTVTMPVASPFPSDTRAQPYAANLLDLQIAGVGATPETWCLVGRLELAPVSGYYARLATQEQPGHSIVVPVGHAGVALLLDALYTKRAQLDAVSCVDLLQAAAFLQVECCLRAAGQYLMDHVFSRHAAAVLRVARSLGLKALRQQINTHIAANFFMFAPPTLAALLREMGTEEAEALLGRQDLCCPLEFFLVQVLLMAAELPPAQHQSCGLDVVRLLNCVRWGSMSAAELRAVALFARRLPFVPPGGSSLIGPEVLAALAWRLVDASARLASPSWAVAGGACPGGGGNGSPLAAAAAAAAAAGGPAPRDAASRTLQLPLPLGSCGELPPLVPPLRSEARRVAPAGRSGEGAEWAFLELSPTKRGSGGELRPELSLGAVEGSFAPGLVLCFLCVGASGVRVGQLQPTPAAGPRWHRAGFFTAEDPLQSGDGAERLLLLGCFVAPQRPAGAGPAPAVATPDVRRAASPPAAASICSNHG